VKRRLLGLGLATAIGAIVTVVAAWRAIYLGPRPGWVRKLAPQQAAELWRRHVPVEWGHETIIVNDVLMPAWGHETISVSVHFHPGLSEVYLVSMLDTGSNVPKRPRACRYLRAGWPFRALEGVKWSEPQGQTRRALWEPSSGRFRGRSASNHAYPFGPLWTGFLADTVVYAAGVWLLVAAVGRTRRRARLDRRVCPQCRYDLRAATGASTVTCPECGTELAAAWLTRPRQVLRWWMAPAVVPAALLGAQLLGGWIRWPLVLRKLIWPDPVATGVTVAVFLAVAGGLYVLVQRSYRDRPPAQRHLLSALVALAATGVALVPLYVLVARVVA
jgi:predicted RNA-binding Zn-ribbon protein involved in translation (DUF1610 family)